MTRQAEIPKFYSEDVQKIRSYLRRFPRNFIEARNRAIIALLLKTGVKTHILTSLNISDYNRKKKVLTPTHQKAPPQIVLDRQTDSILQNYFDYRRLDHLKPLFISSRKSQYVQSDDELRISERQIQRIVKDLAKKKNLRADFTPKAFRHTLGIYYTALGVEALVMDSILGNIAPWVKRAYRQTHKIKVVEKIQEEKMPPKTFICSIHKHKMKMFMPKRGRILWLCPTVGCGVTVVDRGNFLEKDKDAKELSNL